MPKLRRIVFGEPKPGGSQFAGLLSKLDESVSYCNRTGPLQHDRVTDVPFTIPILGLDFSHPTPLQFVSAEPPANDPYGIFRYHHAALYLQGVIMEKLDPIIYQSALLCTAIYTDFGVWDAQAETSGVVWALKKDGPRAYVVFRGSKTLFDWLNDLTALDPKVLASRIQKHDTFGLMWDGFLIGMDDTWKAISPLISESEEVIFTGHSLGAARAGVAAGFALR